MDSSIRRLLSAISQLSSGGLILGGLVGAAAVSQTGPFLAMGLAIWSGQTTEPATPALAYPWLLQLGAGVGWGLGLWCGHRLQGRDASPYRDHLLAGALLWGSGVLAALLPMMQLYWLWGET